MRIFSQEISPLISEIPSADVRWPGQPQSGVQLDQLQLSRSQQPPQNILKIRVPQNSQDRLRTTFI